MGKQNAGLKNCICEFKNDFECAAWNRLGFLNLNFFSKLAEPFLFQISLVILLTASHKNYFDISSENTELDQIIFPPVEIFLFSPVSRMTLTTFILSIPLMGTIDTRDLR